MIGGGGAFNSCCSGGGGAGLSGGSRGPTTGGPDDTPAPVEGTSLVCVWFESGLESDPTRPARRHGRGRGWGQWTSAD